MSFRVRCGVIALLCLAMVAGALYLHRHSTTAPEPPPYPGTEVKRNVTIMPEQVHDTALINLARSQARWLQQQMEPGGRLPSGVPATPLDPLPRQWLATLALGQWATISGGSRDMNAFIRNLHYRLGADRVQRGTRIYLRQNNASHLASNAFAAEALRLALPTDDAWQPTYTALLNGIAAMYRGEGIFTAALNQTSSDRHAATPAALVALERAALHNTWRYDVQLIDDSISDLYAHWKKTKSISAAPWTLLAFETLAQPHAVFAIADRLVLCQRADNTDPLRWGSFSRSECAQASDSPIVTAMGAQGLAAAYRIAQKERDGKRAARYKAAYLLAMRQVIQLTATDSATPADIGDPTIRIDGPAYVIMAVLEWMR